MTVKRYLFSFQFSPTRKHQNRLHKSREIESNDCWKFHLSSPVAHTSLKRVFMTTNSITLFHQIFAKPSDQRLERLNRTIWIKCLPGTFHIYLEICAHHPQPPVMRRVVGMRQIGSPSVICTFQSLRTFMDQGKECLAAMAIHNRYPMTPTPMALEISMSMSIPM